MVRHHGPVLVDTNAILECFRVGFWRVLSSGYYVVRAHIVNVFRRDLIGPGLQDADLANERLNESPARWYLAGFLAPAGDPLTLDGDDDEADPSAQEEMEIDVEEPDGDGAGGAAVGATLGRDVFKETERLSACCTLR